MDMWGGQVDLFLAACRNCESVPDISYAKVERWFSKSRMEAMAVTDGQCILHCDLIAFPVNIGNIHWIDCLLSYLPDLNRQYVLRLAAPLHCLCSLMHVVALTD